MLFRFVLLFLGPKSGTKRGLTVKALLKIQSETKAIGQELIYEVKLQTSAWPGRP